MKGKVARQEEEEQTLEQYIQNQGEKYDPQQSIWPPQNDPRDVVYKNINYQITYGNQERLANHREKIKLNGGYTEIFGILPKNLEEFFQKEFLDKPLQKKQFQSSKDITLLIDCTYPTGFYDPDMVERKIFAKNFSDQNNNLINTWQNVFLIFHDGNIKL